MNLAPVREEVVGGLPRDVSRHGHEIDSLLHTTGVFTIILFAVVVGWLAIALIRHRGKHQAVHDHGDRKRPILLALGVSAGIFLVVDGNLFVQSTLDVATIFWNHDAVEKDPDAVRVEVNARQWAWDVRYAGADRRFATPDDVVLANELVVPTGAPIIVQLAAVDVVHSFYLPNFRVKMDAVPGRITRLWFEATTPGEYDLACAQHCGVAHYRMRGTIRVLTPEDYALWRAQAEAQAPLRRDANDPHAEWGWPW